MAHPDLHQAVANNAYRRLGLGGGATQQEIDAAARKMRLWTDPAMIAATPWDLLELGSLHRARADIDEAQTGLMDPLTRVQARMIWYCRTEPPVDLASSLSTRPAADEDIAAAHDGAVRLLHQAVCMNRMEAWASAFHQCSALCLQPRYVQWMQEVERHGRFEKRADDAEVAQQVEQFPARLADAVLDAAEIAMDQSRHQQAVSLLYVLRVENRQTLTPQIIAPMLDRLEDQIQQACAQMKTVLHAGYDPSALERLYAANAEPIYLARDVYDKTIAPRLPALRALASDDPDRTARVRVSCAQALMLMATRWKWSGNDDQEQKTLTEAAEIARGTGEELPIEKRRRAKSAATEVAQPDNRPTSVDSSTIVSTPPPPQRVQRRRRSLVPAQAAILAILFTLGMWRLLTSFIALATRRVPSSRIQDSSDEDFENNNELYNRYFRQQAEQMKQQSSTAPAATQP